jgi:hypothetical protein
MLEFSLPDPDAAPAAKRRQFAVEYKLRIRQETDRCTVLNLLCLGAGVDRPNCFDPPGIRSLSGFILKGGGESW